MPYAYFTQSRVVENGKRGTPEEIRFDAGQVYAMSRASLARWERRGCARPATPDQIAAAGLDLADADIDALTPGRRALPGLQAQGEAAPGAGNSVAPTEPAGTGEGSAATGTTEGTAETANASEPAAESQVADRIAQADQADPGPIVPPADAPPADTPPADAASPPGPLRIAHSGRGLWHVFDARDNQLTQRPLPKAEAEAIRDGKAALPPPGDQA